jgi:hypothetical protein
MTFSPNSMLLITDITRGFKIFDHDIDTWVSEGWLPEYRWCNGRRYWDSDKFLEFMNSSNLTQDKLRKEKSNVDNIASVVAIIFAAVAIMMLYFRQM